MSSLEYNQRFTNIKKRNKRLRKSRSNHENFRNPITANTLYANGTDNRFNNKLNQNLSQNNFRDQNFPRNLVTCVLLFKKS